MKNSVKLFQIISSCAIGIAYVSSTVALVQEQGAVAGMMTSSVLLFFVGLIAACIWDIKDE